jgi:ferredoxin
MHALYDRLRRYSADDWRRAIDTLIAEVHPIDQAATRIWFAFFPLDLFLRLEAAPDAVHAARTLGLMGRWRLEDQVDESHRFLFAHRFWPQVKNAIAAVEAPPEQLPALITQVADAATRRARVDRDMLIGISAVGLMTLRQAGVTAFEAAPGRVHLSDRARAMTPHQILKRRNRDDWQGVFGFLRGVMKRWTVRFDEADPAAVFTVIHGQEMATAAQSDKRDYRSRDPRCIPGEGPIPVECRAASCGTCWVGILAGAEKLSPVIARDEGRRMKVFGYRETDGEQPLVRLACQAKAYGAVTLVIPPWNGIFGK